MGSHVANAHHARSIRENADYPAMAISSASMNIFATSNPLCCVIS
jgi:hypothetical protein